MAEISQEKLREILQNAPPGTTQEGIVAVPNPPKVPRVNPI